MHEDFPTLAQGEVYLDSATTSLVPRSVQEVVLQAMRAGGSAGRSLHGRGYAATQALARARSFVARDLSVQEQELVFVPSTTVALNLVAQGWAAPRLGPADQVLVSVAEHNANFLPWHRVCRQSGAALLPVAVDAHGQLDLEDLRAKLRPQTKVIALTHVSNVTGACTDIARVVELIRVSPAADALVVVDGAQAIAHLRASPAQWGCDFYAYSGHKCYGVPGAGVLWGAKGRWGQCEPLWVGGGSVEQASFDTILFKEGPERFESGTANLPAIAGLAAGLEYARAHQDQNSQSELLSSLAQRLEAMPGVRVLGHPSKRVGCVSWVHQGIHAHDMATLLDEAGIALRVGHHCAQRLLEHFGVHTALRASLAHFNHASQLELLCAELDKAREILG